MIKRARWMSGVVVGLLSLSGSGVMFAEEGGSAEEAEQRTSSERAALDRPAMEVTTRSGYPSQRDRAAAFRLELSQRAQTGTDDLSEAERLNPQPRMHRGQRGYRDGGRYTHGWSRGGDYWGLRSSRYDRRFGRDRDSSFRYLHDRGRARGSLRLDVHFDKGYPQYPIYDSDRGFFRPRARIGTDVDLPRHRSGEAHRERPRQRSRDRD